MKWLAEKPSFVRYHLCVTMRKHRAWVCRATSAMRFWAISCWASAQNGSTSEVRHLVCTGNFFFIDHCSMFNAVPVSDLLPPLCVLCKKPQTNTHTHRGLFRGGENSSVQLGQVHWIPRVSAWHIPSFRDTSVSLLWCYITDWVMLHDWLLKKKNCLCLKYKLPCFPVKLAFCCVFFFPNKELWNIYYLLRILCVDQGKWSIMVHTLSGIYRGPCPPTPQLEPNIYHPLVKILSFNSF